MKNKNIITIVIALVCLVGGYLLGNNLGQKEYEKSLETISIKGMFSQDFRTISLDPDTHTYIYTYPNEVENSNVGMTKVKGEVVEVIPTVVLLKTGELKGHYVVYDHGNIKLVIAGDKDSKEVFKKVSDSIMGD